MPTSMRRLLVRFSFVARMLSRADGDCKRPGCRPRSGWPELRKRDLLRYVVEGHDDRHADPDAFGVTVDDVCHHPRSFGELDDRQNERRLPGKARMRRAIVHRKGIDRAGAARLLPVEGARQAMTANPARVDLMLAAGSAFLNDEAVLLRRRPIGFGVLVRSGQRYLR